jgi:hypothetical protein
MMVRLGVLIVGVLAATCSGSVASSFSDLSGPYLGQQPPELEPVPFAEGLIAFAHSSLSISPDGAEIYWADRTAGPMSSHIVSTRRLDNGWSEPAQVFPDSISQSDCPVISPDGQRLLFNSIHPLIPGERETERLWVSERLEGGWDDPAPLADVVNTFGLHWQCSVDAAGNLYFGAVPPHGGSDDDIYVSQWVDGEFAHPEVMGISTTWDETTPFMDPEEEYVLVSRVDGRSGHIAASFRGVDGSWTEPIALDLGELAFPVCPYVSPDGEYLFVLSGATVYWVDAQIIEASRPQQPGDATPIHLP